MLKEIQELTGEIYLHGFFDFGKDAYSTLEIEVDTGIYEENIEIILGEAAGDGKILRTPGYCTFIQHLTTAGPGPQTIRIPIRKFAPAFSGFPYCPTPAECDGEIAPFRYVEVNRHYGKITLRRTAYYCDWDDSAVKFTSSDPLLNKIWNFCNYSIKAASVFDKYIDGERERMPYEGDAYINQLGHFCGTLPDFSKARTTIDHFFEFDRFTWPAEWFLITPSLIYDYYLYSGDRASVEKWCKNELLDKKLLLDCRDENGLLNRKKYPLARPGSQLNDLVDWPKTERDDYDFQEVNFVPNAYLYNALRVMHRLTGKNSYQHEAEKLKNAIRKHFLKNGRFVDSTGSGHTALHTAIFALAFDLAENEEITLLKGIIRSKDMACSVYCAQFLLEVCFRCGMAGHAIALMTSEKERSWFNMLAEGATITMESWGNKWKPNQDWNHAWGAAPANIIPRYLAGIRPLAGGFTRFAVDPQPGNLKNFHFSQKTVSGTVDISYDGEKFFLTVPQGTQAVYRGEILEAGVYSLQP